MPLVTCPYCAAPASLPDPWTAPGYTCPHCHRAVAFAVPAAGPPPLPAPDALDFEESPRRRGEYRNKTRARDAARTGFGDAFGRKLGEHAAGCLVFGIVGAVILVVIAALMLRH